MAWYRLLAATRDYPWFEPVEMGGHIACPPCTTWSNILSIILGYDPTTLRERVDLRAAGDRLTELGDLRSLSALSEKVALLRLVGRLDEAWELANEAVRQARFTGDREQLLGSRIRRAQVLQYQGKLEEAYKELSGCVDEARIHDWAALEAFASQHRGKVLFDQHEFEGAVADFASAVSLREKLGASTGELESALIALAVAESFLDEERRRE